MPDAGKNVPLAVRLLGFMGALVCALLLLDHMSRREFWVEREALSFLRTYAAWRDHVAARWQHYVAGAAIVTLATTYIFKRMARSISRFEERAAGMAFREHTYALGRSVVRRRGGQTQAMQERFLEALRDNPHPEAQVVLGLDPNGRAVHLTDEARSMHVHLLGQTGSGKTQSVIYPLLFQDVWRHRGVVFLDAKGSIENEEMLAKVAAARGRRLHLFSLNPGREAQTYNPLHMKEGADPQGVAERVFSTFADEMDNPYYRDMARELFINLVRALASTGKRMCMWDIAACLSDEAILHRALNLATDEMAVARIKTRLARLGDKFDLTYSGLLAAVNRYDHPAVNSYTPDIVLEDIVESGGIVGFSLSANAYKFLARCIGIIVLQHIQQIGAARQMDRSRSQAPVYVYADEFYNFAYDGFVDAVNKLRDAHISLLLSHQSLADLDRVSKEYARAVWDNTRNKIVLYQSDPELCERLSATIGTRKAVALTVRRSADGWLNQVSMLEASSRQVDEFVLHPSQPKNLTRGQAYLVQAGLGSSEEPLERRRWPFGRSPVAPSAGAIGVNLALLKPLPAAPLPVTAGNDTALGLRLYEGMLSRRDSR